MGDARRIVMALAVATLVAGCGDGAGQTGDGPPDPDGPYYRVLEDDHATPDEVIAVAGAPSGIGRTSDGATLLTYRISDQEGGEAEKGAWRLIGPDGDVVTSRAASSYVDVTSFADGFFLTSGSDGTDWSWVDETGQERTIAKALPSAATQPGDALVSDVSDRTVYRPSDGSLHRAPKVPGEDDDSYPLIAIDASDGSVWAVPSTEAASVPLEHSADGRTGWSSRDVPRPTNAQAGPYDMVAGQGRMVMTFAELMAEDGDKVEDVVLSEGSATRSLIGTGLPVNELHDPTLGFLPDGRLLVGEGGEKGEAGWFVATNPANTSFTQLKTPETFGTMEVAGADLVAIGKHPYVSADAGRTWRRITTG